MGFTCYTQNSDYKTIYRGGGDLSNTQSKRQSMGKSYQGSNLSQPILADS